MVAAGAAADLYCLLHTMKRSPDKDIHDFLNEFDFEYEKFQAVYGALQEPIPAFMLLLACALNETEGRVVRAGLRDDVNYDSMRETLKRVFSAKQSAQFNSAADTKTEQIFFAGDEGTAMTSEANWKFDDETFFARGGYNSRNVRRRSGGRSQRLRGGTRSRGARRFNGYRGSCWGCGSFKHIFRNCPEKNKTNTNDYWQSGQSSRDRSTSTDNNRDVSFSFPVNCETNFSFPVSCETNPPIDVSLFVGCTDNDRKFQALLEESYGFGILDSGCANTVCGDTWLQNYVDRLSVSEKANICFQRSNETFTFGDGKTVSSKRQVTLPCWMAGINCNITTDVVQCAIPLLISRKSMTRMKMNLDFEDHVAYLKEHKRSIKLKITQSGHYALPLGL